VLVEDRIVTVRAWRYNLEPLRPRRSIYLLDTISSATKLGWTGPPITLRRAIQLPLAQEIVLAWAAYAWHPLDCK